MIEFEQALKLILRNSKELGAETVLVDNSVGRSLAEDVYSKLQMPPFNKSAMDGYALKAIDVTDSHVRLKCVGFIEAGQTFRKRVRRGECVKIMTGAPLPQDTDSVVMVEETRRFGELVGIARAVKRGQNVCVQGEDIKKGEKVLVRRRVISVSDVALLAAVGKKYVKVIKRPEVGVLNTGGEIIPAGRRLPGNKIYNSNGPQLLALLKSDGIRPHFLGIAKDDLRELKKAVRKGLEKDILLISGGVSQGDYDLVPSVLKSLGVKEVFHKIKVKPGKPLFFGKYKNRLIFGIPGNPVSNFLAYLLFIRPALSKMSGGELCEGVFKEGVLTKTFCHKIGRKHFVPAKISKRGSRYYVYPVESHGSADILALSKANGFMIVDRDCRLVKAKSKIEFITWK
ncbi:MAG: molybdopterin molybdotransferase MoeA [Candidatus Omnitrophica bacterium]|nr:molybdopterin molybdotransferase MoeA [Candidatus Omnitrophota bacterium]